MAGQKPDFNAGLLRKVKGFAELRMHQPVGAYFRYTVHLNYECKNGMISGLQRTDQLADMLYSPLRRCVRKIPHPVNLQGASFHFHQVLLVVSFHVKVDSGIPVSVLRNHFVAASGTEPFPDHLVGRLAVDIKQNSVALSHSHQIVFRLSVRRFRRGQPDLASRNQKLPASACIFHVHNFFVPFDLHFGNEPVRSVQE